jgi:hypothetical protein
LHEELQQKARKAGKLPDEAMTLAYLREFGRPADVAARYHQPITLIEPADTPAFLFLSIVGVSLASVLPYVDRIRGREVVVREWPEALWVVGLLVIIFAVMSYVRRRAPQKNHWKPHRMNQSDIGPARTLISLAFGVVALLVYAFPGEAAELFRVNYLNPALNADAFTFTEDFRTWRFPWRFQWLFLLAVPIFAFNLHAVITGRWTKLLRWLEIMFSISLALQLGWHASYGMIVVGKEADNFIRLVFMMADISILLQAAIRAWHEWGRIDAPAGLPGGAAQQKPA